MRARAPALLLVVAFVAACGSSPTGVVEDLGEYAEKRNLVKFRKLFSTRSVDTLQRRWREDGLTPTEGWLDLMVGYLGADREPPEVIAEEEKAEDLAIVKVVKEMEKQKKRIVQDLTLVKEDDRWRLSIGEMVFVEEDIETGEKKLPVAVPVPTEDDDWGLEDAKKKKKGREDLKDFDLEDF